MGNMQHEWQHTKFCCRKENFWEIKSMWKCDIKTNLKDLGCKDAKWTELAQNEVQLIGFK